MASLKIENVPQELVRQLEDRAREKGTSVDVQAAELLSRALKQDVEGVAQDEAALLAEIRRERDEMARGGVCLTEESITEAKRWGRE